MMRLLDRRRGGRCLACSHARFVRIRTRLTRSRILTSRSLAGRHVPLTCLHARLILLAGRVGPGVLTDELLMEIFYHTFHVLKTPQDLLVLRELHPFRGRVGCGKRDRAGENHGQSGDDGRRPYMPCALCSFLHVMIACVGSGPDVPYPARAFTPGMATRGTRPAWRGCIRRLAATAAGLLGLCFCHTNEQIRVMRT